MRTGRPKRRPPRETRRETTIKPPRDIANAETQVLPTRAEDDHPVTREAQVRDDLPPARDGGVAEEAHRRAAVEAATQPPPGLADGVELIGEYAGSGFRDAPYIARRADGQVIQMAK